MRLSSEDIQRHRSAGPWKVLETRAQLLVADARRHGGDSFQPLLGGGTRLMLALNHRLSDDIDLFVDSPAWLPYVSPRLNDMFESELAGYNEDNAHVKLRFAEGEIDFVVAAPLLPGSATTWNPTAPETSFPMEPPAEVPAILLGTKLEGIETALAHMVQRQSQHLAWERIRTDRLPQLDQAAQWANARLALWSRLASAA
ncbi:nucleotidyl transferase AbiEii/AbiGii toxin family protein [Achromobacter xylosoxidans]|uniref:Nucleotidyl transferase AbiEii/AbiGii toxin family protein n=1 Tax=Alcaligenes xylosoxydans xylosoxydans TaxID=85698 RepID=A0A0X8P0J8_ALCXX|nr:nucleotidyl transferase AbiEii/AbiGii toxin family protein [Achromobacter xylosoxidans]AMG37659.1 hypothetical protein AL504_17625 [Achromobacter xylosoxidans]